ncbi:hypothetical protein N9F40_01225 [bacterium]|jgi:hypothetical protein|nr:hypothetical protein [bacterium]
MPSIVVAWLFSAKPALNAAMNFSPYVVPSEVVMTPMVGGGGGGGYAGVRISD